MKQYVKYLLLFSLGFLLVYGTIVACSDGWGWNFDSNFAPETFVDDAYKPLFLSDDVFYSSVFDMTHVDRFRENIRKDWHAYLRQKLDTATINQLVFALSSNELQAIQQHPDGKLLPDSLKTIAAKLNLKANHLEKTVEYLLDARFIEKYSTLRLDYWDYDAVQKKSYVPPTAVSDLEKKFEKCKDGFLKNRYWYLTNKAWFYSEDASGMSAFFEKTQNTIAKDYLYYSALSYVAGVQYKNKNYLQSNYLFSLAFDECPEIRTTATYNFHPVQDAAQWQANLALAKNNAEKAGLWALQGYYSDEAVAIENIYGFDPQNRNLDFLLTRMINKIEHLNFYYSYEEGKKVQHPFVVPEEKYTLIKRIAAENKTSKQYLWNISLGYLEFLKSNFKEAEAYFTLTEKSMPKTPLAKDQLHLLRMVNTIGSITNSEDLNKKDVVNDLYWLFKQLNPDDYLQNPLRVYNSQEWVKGKLTRMFEYEKNVIYKELLSPEVSFYQSDESKNRMKIFLDKPDKTDLERFLVDMYDIKMEDIMEYEAIRATFENKIPEAIALMEKAPTLGQMALPANPFNGFIKDCHECEFALPQKNGYSKISFLKAMSVMQEKVARNEDMFNNCLLLGNAFYNISHFGNARVFYQGKIIPAWTTPFDYDVFSKKLLTSNAIAEAYYQKAFDHAENKEQKAKTLFMLSKCERNAFYNQKYYFVLNNFWDMYYNDIMFKAWNGFRQLKESYSDTRYYQEAINECGYFKTYVEKN